MVLRICGSLCFLAFFYFTTQVNAATTIPYQTRPPLQEYLPVDSSGNIRTSTTYETKAVTPAGQNVTRYTTRNTPVSKATLGRMTKGALVGPLGIGIAAALIAADYFIDPVTGDIVVTSEPEATIGYRWSQPSSSSSPTSWPHVDPQTACLAHNWYNPDNLPITSHPNGTSDTAYDCDIGGSFSGLRVRRSPTTYDCPTGTADYGDGYCTPTSSAPSSTATDDQVGDVVANNDINNSNKIIPSLIPDSVSTGRWRDEWPEAVSDSESINDTLENDIEGATNPTTDPTVTDSSTAAPPPVPVTTNEPMSAEWPLFCDWATVVCDFIDWVTDFDEANLPDHPLLPEREIEMEEYTSGIPATASCPANIPFNITFPIQAQYELDLVPVCDLASDIRPFVILSAYLVAAFVLVGSIRS